MKTFLTSAFVLISAVTALAEPNHEIHRIPGQPVPESGTLYELNSESPKLYVEYTVLGLNQRRNIYKNGTSLQVDYPTADCIALVTNEEVPAKEMMKLASVIEVSYGNLSYETSAVVKTAIVDGTVVFQFPKIFRAHTGIKIATKNGRTFEENAAAIFGLNRFSYVSFQYLRYCSMAE